MATIDSPGLGSSVDRCTNCGEPGLVGGSWCRACGYYPTLGTCVEVDQQQPMYENGHYVGPESTADTGMWNAIPGWAWQLAAVMLVIGLASALGAYFTADNLVYRAYLSLAEIGLSLVCILGAHLFVAVRAFKCDRTLAPLDIVFSPLRLWYPSFLDLPESIRRVGFGVGGVWAIVLAHLFLGMPYLSLINLDHTPEKKKQKRAIPVGALAGAANNSESQSLEEAIEELGGTVSLEKGTSSPNVTPTGPVTDDLSDVEGEATTEEFNCLIIGYRQHPETGEVTSLIVAAKPKRIWRVMGNVSAGLTPELLQEILPQLPQLRRDTPPIATQLPGQWLDPSLRCRVQADYQENGEKFSNLKLLEML